jgi:MOSC domain-containing protein YiiM
LQRYEARLARALAQVINILDPDAIVLGGGLSNMERLYENVPRLWGEHIFSDQVSDPPAEAPPWRLVRRARRGLAMAMIAPVVVDGLFRGKVGFLPGESRGSAIAKEPIAGPCVIGLDGLAGDEHADPRAHGGDEKAVHLFPAEHHAALAAAFPGARHLVPGGLGENLSTRGITEEQACIGDVFALGSALLQVAQPRTPCWKIDSRCGVEGIAAFVAEHGIAGWYFRVLAPGVCLAGDVLTHVERPAGAVSLARFNRSVAVKRPALAVLDELAQAPGLAQDWVRKIRDRMDWLLRNGDNL